MIMKYITEDILNFYHVNFLCAYFAEKRLKGRDIRNCVKCSVDSKFIPCRKQTQQEVNGQFITIPYFGHPSVAFAHKLRQSFKTNRYKLVLPSGGPSGKYTKY